MAILLVTVGLLSGVALDLRLRHELDRNSRERLSHKFWEDLSNFDRRTKALQQAATIITAGKKFYDHVITRQQLDFDRIETYNRPPAWLPEPEVMKNFPQISHALLIDQLGMVSEAYNHNGVATPQALLHPSAELLQMSKDKNLLATADHRPYLVTSHSLDHEQGRTLATLMLATIIDDRFLQDSVSPQEDNQILALINGVDQQIIASSTPELLAAGSKLRETTNRYRVIEQASLDYNSYKGAILFAALSPAGVPASAQSVILNSSRRQNALLALVLTMTAVLASYLTSGKIQGLCRQLQRIKGLTIKKTCDSLLKGDELNLLSSCIENIRAAVPAAIDQACLQTKNNSLDTIRNAYFAVITIDQDKRISSWNPAAEAIFGWPAKKVLGKKLPDLIFPNKHCVAFEIGIPGYITKGDTSLFNKQFKKQALHCDGHRFPLELSVSPIDIDYNTSYIVYARDVTEWELREARAKNTYQNQRIINSILTISMEAIPLQEQLQHALNNILQMKDIELLPQGAILLTDEESNTLSIVAHQNFSREQLAQCKRIPFDQCQCGRAATTRQIQFIDTADDHDPEHPGMSPHGHYCVPLFSGDDVHGVIALYVADGHQKTKEETNLLLAIANILAGLIERKKIEDQLYNLIDNLKQTIDKLENEKKFSESIIQSLSNGLMVLDLDGRIISCNPNGKQLLKSFATDIEGKKLSEIFGDAAAHILTDISQSLPQKNDELALRTSKGHERTLGFTIAARDDANNNTVGIIVSFTDITGIKQIRKEMEKMNRLSTIAEIASAVAHEVRNPLAGIKTMSQSIDENLAKNDEKKEYIRRIINQVDRLNELLTDFFTYARPPKPSKAKTSLAGIINDIKPLINARLLKNHITFREDYDPNLPEIIADPSQIQQIFLNLILNSIDAIGQKGSIEIKAKQPDAVMLENYSITFPGLSTSTEQVVVHFKDTGSGIPDEIADKVFEPFFTTKHDGAGLGLSIVYRIMQENNASIYIDTGAEEGTTFIMFFEADAK
ncbi:MAG: PAS domain S-box protein [Desulfobulbaceae bacterium]|nr:PAS domain S-box protein [Desulfobulbaceae bacterium]HIJ79803.1 PAS domain S-box protein [Deltaproteobacteria bacterium]